MSIDLDGWTGDDNSREIISRLSKIGDLYYFAQRAAMAVYGPSYTGSNNTFLCELNPGDMTRYSILVHRGYNSNDASGPNREKFIVALANFNTSIELDDLAFVTDPHCMVYGRLTNNYASASVLAYYLFQIVKARG